jgi:ATP-dependent exoDNAse (exonuclease V) beta subunit
LVSQIEDIEQSCFLHNKNPRLPRALSSTWNTITGLASHTRFNGLASYETLFGVKPLGPTAQKKADNGEETTIERTRRLLYVTCTRAEESLALVLYSEVWTRMA